MRLCAFFFIPLLFLFSSKAFPSTPDISILQYDKLSAYEQSGKCHLAIQLARKSLDIAKAHGMEDQVLSLSNIIQQLEDQLLENGCTFALFDEEYAPRPKTLQLLSLLGMPENQERPPKLTEIDKWAQKHLLRVGGRWDPQTPRFDPLRKPILELLNEIGFIQPVSPSFDQFDGAIVLGAHACAFRERLAFLKQSWQSGVRFQRIYLLGCMRPLLTDDLETSEKLLTSKFPSLPIREDWVPPMELPKTECEMLGLVWDQSELPDEMRNGVEVTILGAPMKEEKNSVKPLQPKTEDFVEEWLRHSPPHGRYLAITSLPFLLRQSLVVRRITPASYTFDFVGPGANLQLPIPIFLDEFANLIHETCGIRLREEFKR